MIARLLGAVLAAVTALGPSSPDPVGDQMPIDLMEASTVHPFWTLDPDEVARFDRLSVCESGGRWDLNVGPFDGGIQFLPSTWTAVGGPGTAWEASREEQIWRGHLLRVEVGWSAWPGCARKFGWLS